MKNIIDIAVELAARLNDFGRTDQSRAIIERATELNPWFTASDICMAIEAISRQMLCREKLQRWLAAYHTLPHATPRKVGIIMAGNLPLVGFFDLLCTLAASDEAWIKPSSKDSVLTNYICDLMREIEPAIPIYIYDDKTHLDAVIATGGEEANKYFESKFKDCYHLLRSSRHSIAVIDNETTAEQLQLLAKDIYAYSGLGCRNVAMIFAPRGTNIEIPIYDTNSKYKNNYLQTKALLTINGSSFRDNGISVIIESKEFPHTLSTISVVEYDSKQEVEAWIAEHDYELQCIVSQAIEHPRRVNFGEAQEPTLFDYADGIDTMEFLAQNKNTK